MIRIELTQSEIHAGDPVKGRVVWTSDSGKAPRKIVVTARRVLAGKGVKQETVAGSVEENDVGSRSEIVVPFEFELPALGPLTYAGKLFSISWDVTARADLPFAVDDVETKAFVVGPAVWTKEQFEAFGEIDSDDESFDEEEDPTLP